MKATWNGATLAESDETIEVGGQVNPDAAWYYPDPKDAAAEIKDSFAFWKGVEVGE